MGRPQKITSRTTICLTFPLWGIYLRMGNSNLNIFVFPHNLFSFQNHQELETTNVSSRQTENVIHVHNGILHSHEKTTSTICNIIGES